MGKSQNSKLYGLNILPDDVEYDGRYDMPTLKPCTILPQFLLPFNYARVSSNKQAFCHFFLDDYQFQRVWTNPTQNLGVIKKFEGALTPDFSLYTNYPIAVQIWNTYRSRAVGVYWQSQGVNVIPTISWSDEWSYDFCFDGAPKDSIVAVSSVGVRSQQEVYLFEKGFEEMIRRLVPRKIVFYGRLLECCQGYEEHIVKYDSFWGQ